MERLPSERVFPINQLPRDILAEVFIQCLLKFENWSSIDSGGLSTERVAPLLLCSVCSSWRNLALSVPRLWQSLFLCFSGTTPQPETEEVITLIHEWIKRSGALPLTLSLRVVMVHGYLLGIGFPAMVEAVLGAFIQYVSRWEHFHYMNDIPITFPEFGNMPQLRSFSLRGSHLKDAKLQITSWPMLTALCWPLHPTAPSSPSLPWHQLTHLVLEHFVTARETLLVIQSCPKLTELETEAYDDEDILDQLPHGTAVVNHCLRKLVLSVGECVRLFESLTLPVLTDMTLHFNFSVGPRVHQELLSFFSRSKCKLDRLHLVDPSFDDDKLLKCLQHDSCASITDLSVEKMFSGPMVTDPILAALTHVPSSESDILLPKLAHLEFQMCLGGSPGMLGMMLVSRCIMLDEEDQLKTVKINCLSLSPPDTVLLALAETHGLKVTLDI